MCDMYAYRSVWENSISESSYRQPSSAAAVAVAVCVDCFDAGDIGNEAHTTTYHVHISYAYAIHNVRSCISKNIVHVSLRYSYDDNAYVKRLTIVTGLMNDLFMM